MIYFSLNKSNGTEDTVYEKEDQVPYSNSFYCSTAPNRPVLRLSLQKPVQRTKGVLPQKPARGGCRKAITRIQEHGCLLGMWGDIRETDSANSPIVYCDPNGVVKHIIIRSKKFRSSVSANQTLCESRFFGIQINPPYALIPYGGFTVL